MSRRKGRILAFQGLYSWDVGGVALEDVLKLSWADKEIPGEVTKDGEESVVVEPVDEESAYFARILISGAVEHIEEIDKLITEHLSSMWTFDRVNKVSLAILRMSVYALEYQKDIPASIVIDEAIDIAKEYGQDDSFKFINAVLDTIRKK